ncbi:MAG: efflux RND transporter periplasmic adaptor subunit [Myxacorys chilensis ATA2-1-KO14]|nr:efflux RND transporter periplasmic adaptor subunit [Myxacorys chilensis ATA2-1-KO14]
MQKQVYSFARLIPLMLVLSWLNACRSAAPEANASQGEGIPVQISDVQSAIVDRSDDFNATLESRQSVNIKPRIEGQVAQIFVRAGEAVKAGQPILQIDPRKQAAAALGSGASADSAQAGVSSAQAGVTSARANLKTAKATLAEYQETLASKSADYDRSKSQYSRYDRLYKAGAVSADLVEQYFNNLKTAQASLRSAQAKIDGQQEEIAAKEADLAARQADVSRSQRTYQQAQALTEEEQVQLQYFRITAPFSGTIGELPVKEGDLVSQATTLGTLTQNSDLEVNVSIPTEKARQVNLGTRIDLIDSQGKQVGSSRVFAVSPKVSTETQTVLVKALVENAGSNLRADQQIRARVIWERQPGMMIPTTAISRLAGQNFVYVAEPKDGGLIAKQKPIQVGVIRGNNQQVIDGLKPNEKIVATGLQKISDGSSIVNEAEMSKAAPEEHKEEKK